MSLSALVRPRTSHRRALKRWDEHCERNPDAESGYMQELIEEGSAQVVEMEPGSAVIYGLDG